jgi:hypothetical protein
VTGRRGRKLKQLLSVLEGSSRFHCLESSLWSRLWICRKRLDDDDDDDDDDD